MVIEMLENLAVFRTASDMSRHAAKRQNILAANMANSDTPGFKARDMEEFQGLRPNPIRAVAPLPGHGTDFIAGREGRVTEPDLPETLNGNNVTIEDQSLRAASAVTQHELATLLYRKNADLIRLGLGRLR